MRSADHLFLALSGAGGLGGQGGGGMVEGCALAHGLVHGLGIHRHQPGPVGPDQPARWGRDPGRIGLGVEKGGEAGGRRQARAGGNRQSKPGQGAGGATLHHHGGAGRLTVGLGSVLLEPGLEVTGLAAVEQSAQAARMLGVGADQRLDNLCRDFSLLGPQSQGLAAGDEALPSRSQADAPALDRDHRRVERFGGRVGGVHPPFVALERGAELTDARDGTAPLGQRPQGRRQRQAGGAAGCGECGVDHGHRINTIPDRGAGGAPAACRRVKALAARPRTIRVSAGLTCP